MLTPEEFNTLRAHLLKRTILIPPECAIIRLRDVISLMETYTDSRKEATGEAVTKEGRQVHSQSHKQMEETPK